MTKRMSNFKFAAGFAGLISGILFAGISSCNKKVEKPAQLEARQDVPTTVLYESFWGSLLRMEVGDNTICYVYTGNSKGGLNCLKQF